MKEHNSVIHLEQYLICDHDVCRISNIIRESKLIAIARSYLFLGNGYSLGEICNKVDELSMLIDNIELILSTEPILYNTRIVERGIGYNTLGSDIVLDSAKDPLMLDDFIRQIRVPISGQTYFDDTELKIGNVYLIDNVTGFRFTATPDTINLVFNYLDKANILLPWELWETRKV